MSFSDSGFHIVAFAPEHDQLAFLEGWYQLPTVMVSPTPRDYDGMLQDLMASFERQTGLRMSFEDLTGCMNGAHRDVPAMELDIAHQLHACSFCEHAKAADEGKGKKDCVRNKLAVDRLVIRSQAGLHGLCHLGMFDIAEPLILHGRVLGIFYYGSVILRGTEPEIRKRILRYCARRHLDSAPYLDTLINIPVIDSSSIAGHRETLRTVSQVARFLYQTGGLRPEVYKFRALTFPYVDPQNQPPVVKETLRYICAHLNEPFIVKDLAARVNCHPDFLSRKFKQHVGVDLSLYLQQVRIERAKILLENPKLSIDEAAEAAGFSDRIHFSKVFRRLTGLPPGEFRKQLSAAGAGAAQPMSKELKNYSKVSLNPPRAMPRPAPVHGKHEQ